MRKSVLPSRLLLLLLLPLFSCAKKSVDVDLTGISVPEVLQRVKEAQESVKSVKGLASVSVKSPDRALSFNQVTIVKEPNLLHLEALAPFGKVAAVVISDGVKTYVVSQKEKGVFDSFEEFNLSLFYPELPVKITVNDLVDLLLGRLPEGPDYGDSQVYLSKESSYILLTFFEHPRDSVLWVNPLTYRVEKAEINLNGGVPAKCRFKDFKNLGTGVSFPRRIEFEVGEFFISINYESGVEVNSDIDESLFKPQPSLAGFEKNF